VQAGLWLLQTGLQSGGVITNEKFGGLEVWAMPTDLRYGLTDKFEVMVGVNPYFATTEGSGAGIEYTTVNYSGYLRYNVFDALPAGSLAFLGGYGYTSYEGGIASANSMVGKLLYRLPLGKLFQVASNLGYTYQHVNKLDYSESSGGSFTYTASFAWNINNKLGIYVETYGSSGTATSNWLDFGFFWLPSADLQVDLIFASGGNSGFESYYSTLGLCYQFGTPR
jgi:hypothetical protein